MPVTEYTARGNADGSVAASTQVRRQRAASISIQLTRTEVTMPSRKAIRRVEHRPRRDTRRIAHETRKAAMAGARLRSSASSRRAYFMSQVQARQSRSGGGRGREPAERTSSPRAPLWRQSYPFSSDEIELCCHGCRCSRRRALHRCPRTRAPALFAAMNGSFPAFVTLALMFRQRDRQVRGIANASAVPHTPVRGRARVRDRRAPCRSSNASLAACAVTSRLLSSCAAGECGLRG